MQRLGPLHVGTREPHERTGTPGALRCAVLLGAVALGACGGDDAPSIAQDRGHVGDAGDPVADARVANDGAVHVKLTNVGDPCSLLGPYCKGDDAQCMDISYSGAFYTGGYCTADCKSSEECGPGGECPVGDSELVQPGYDFRSTWARKCFKSCSPDDPNACRYGYACMSLADAYLAPDAPAPLHRNVCIPHLPSIGYDAGVRDSGVL